MPLKTLCVCCQAVAEDEYHWFTDEGKEVVWKLCEGCCDFALTIVENTLSYIDDMEETDG